MRKAIGPLLLALVILTLIGLFLLRQLDGGKSGAKGHVKSSVTVTGLVGSEKSGFLNDPVIQSILKEKYGITVNFATAGSISIAGGSDQGQDFLWPASQYARQIYERSHGPALKDDLIFNSPVVMYSWRPITQALERQGIVRRIGQAFYVVNLAKLVHLVVSGRTWGSIGVHDLTGPILVQTTDPTQSNSGFMFAGLLANILNGGRIVDRTSLPKVLPQVKRFFANLGFTQSSTGTLFETAIDQGEGAFPIWVGYENLYIEESITHPVIRSELNRQVNILYPRPTEWSAHIFMALDPRGVRLAKALEDPQIQQLAWQRHGFRSGLIGVQDSPSVLKVAGVPKAIVQTVPLPRTAVMQRILRSLQG